MSDGHKTIAGGFPFEVGGILDTVRRLFAEVAVAGSRIEVIFRIKNQKQPDRYRILVRRLNGEKSLGWACRLDEGMTFEEDVREACQTFMDELASRDSVRLISNGLFIEADRVSFEVYCVEPPVLPLESPQQP